MSGQVAQMHLLRGQLSAVSQHRAHVVGNSRGGGRGGVRARDGGTRALGASAGGVGARLTRASQPAWGVNQDCQAVAGTHHHGAAQVGQRAHEFGAQVVYPTESGNLIQALITMIGGE